MGNSLNLRQQIYLALFLSGLFHFGLLNLRLDMDNDVALQHRYTVGMVFDSLEAFVSDPPDLRQESVVQPVPQTQPSSRPKTVESVGKKTISAQPPQNNGVPFTPKPQIVKTPVAKAVSNTLARPAPSTLPKISLKPEVGTTSTEKLLHAPIFTLPADASASKKPPLDERSETNAIPRYIDNPRPEYPAVARRKGWTGTVRLLVRVDASGIVEKLSVAQSSGFSALDRAARRAVRFWRFVPAMKAGLRVASEVVIPIDFRLPGSAESVPFVQE